MGADFSRVRQNPLFDYAGVELKQGGVLLDADANELVAIVDRRLRALASDTLGRASVSSTTPDAFRITVLAGALQIGRGRLYVDGLLAENHGAASADPAKRAYDDLMAEPAFADPLAYGAQPYLPGPPALPAAGRHLVYLDVWNRELTHLEQPDLVEPAVGVESSSRVQTVWQVRVLADDAGAATTCGTADADVPGWAATIAPSTGVLSTDTFDVAPSDDPCELPPTGGYRGLENQLYRVEIHAPGLPGSGATFKWSRENASVGSRVASVVSGTELELATLGRDDVLRVNTGDWVEIVDDVREFSQAAGELRRVTVDDASQRITFAPALPAAMLPANFPDSAFPAARNLRVRRWDQKGLVFRTDPSGKPVQVQDLDAAGSTGAIKVPAAGTSLLLENGVTVAFDSTGAAGLKAGDYWVFAARTADASVERLDRATPRGVHHHFARLGIWDAGAGTVTDCRHPWPPQGGGQGCGCTQCVSPESHASGQLTIQAAVDKVRDTGGTVCLHAGQYALKEPVRISGARSIRIAGQGPTTTIAAPGTAFVIERSAAIALSALTVFSLGRASAISVRTAFGLALRELAVAVFGNSDFHGAAVALSGAVLDASIENSLLLATDGVRALDDADEQAPKMLLAAALRICDNVFLCSGAAVRLDGAVAHAYDTCVAGNHVIGTRDAGLSTLGSALPGASVRMTGNHVDARGPGIRCALGGAWIADNRLHATPDANRALAGAGIALTAGADESGLDAAHVLANQIDGFPDAGVSVDAPVRNLLVKLNVVEQCGNGIVMTGAASAAAVSIENNQLRDIGGRADATAAGAAAATVAVGAATTIGIGVTRAAAATVAGNTLRRIGLDATAAPLIAGIVTYSVQRPRIGGNEIVEVGPLENFGGTAAGISIRAPYSQAEVHHNHVERDAQFNDTRSDTAWFALSIDEPQLDGNDALSRLARFTALRVDARRTLVLSGDQAFVSAVNAGTAVDPATGAAVAAPGASASVLGNVFVARGRTPAVDVTASGDVLFGENRCELRASAGSAVRLSAPAAIVNANRVSGGQESISVPNPKALVTAIGNITTRNIAAPLRPEMGPLNLIG
ncbi:MULTISPECIES: DUF6519 domain-containing protein [Burkholderia]|uniref:DUF6519 domain-containing protein n=1 Tax=Burkholderia TaxID=32008 RepID=UPI0003280C24|nr:MULTISPECIES: DUF6519 domain-containing protein [Burkholderia]AGK50335.1 right handed beta helix region family protein [Burkholderia thailandensis MSMB121]ATF32494.1 hypothetical protein CO709_03160 [Burkholderia thailandensis]KST70588.1 hypothetical protein WS76_18210 [Burkholderia humptydooensis]KVN11785.1 hypothetical protein WT08_12620 [Burkholderia sp. MSMB1552]KWZ50683.1 hypothetical protein WS92_25295 [Burkholderia sp. MSMB1588]